MKRTESSAMSSLQLPHEPSGQALDDERARHERVQLDRQLELERARAALEPRAPERLMEQERRQAEQRLSIERDAQVRRLEGQRLTLAALLGTLCVGTAVLWAFLLQPELRRERESVKQMALSKSAERLEYQRERASLTTRISDLDSQVRALHLELSRTAVTPPGALAGETKRNVRRPIQTRPAEVHKKPCDARDPLCGDLG